MWLWGIVMLWFLQSLQTNNIAAPFADVPKTATTSENQDRTSEQQFINNLTPVDVKNILEILLLTFKRQPSVPTLRLLNLIIHNLIRHNNATRQLHKNLLTELQHYKELQDLLEDFRNTPNPYTEITPLVTATPSSQYGFTLNSLPQAVTEVLSTPKNSLEHNYTIHTATNSEETKHVFDYKSSTLLPFDNNRFSINSSEANVTVNVKINRYSNSNQQTDSTTETLILLNKSDLIENRMNLYPDRIALNPNSNFDNANNEEHDRKLDVKIISSETNLSFFPHLDEFLLRLLNRDHIKLIRSYSEIFEPYTATEFKKDKSSLHENNLHFSESHKIKLHRRSVASVVEKPSELSSNNHENNHMLELKDEELDNIWKKVFGYALFQTENYPKLTSQPVIINKKSSKSQNTNNLSYNPPPENEENFQNLLHESNLNISENPFLDRYGIPSTSTMVVQNTNTCSTTTKLKIEENALTYTNSDPSPQTLSLLFPIVQKSERQNNIFATLKTSATTPVYENKIKSGQMKSYAKVSFISTPTTRKPLRPPGNK